MNAPDRSESWRLGDEEKMVVYEPDTKIPNAATFVINKEDHTLGNLLRMQLLNDKQVRFAGYMHPHPLTNRIHLKVQTNGENPPHDALGLAIEDLYSEVDNLKQRFRDQVDLFKHQALEQQYAKPGAR
ncbi:unnamed protein product [Phaeothamnion confervicola]